MDDLKGPALVVCPKILNVFENECRRPVVLKNLCNVKEQIALFLIFKAMLAAKTEFFGNTCDAEWLARKAGTQYVKAWNIGNGNFVYVAMRGFAENTQCAPARSNAMRNPPMPQKRSTKRKVDALEFTARP